MLEVEFLKKFPLFSGLSDAQLSKLKSIMRETDFAANQVVIRDGDHGEEMFVLLEGDVEISKPMMLKVETEMAKGKDKSLQAGITW